MPHASRCRRRCHGHVFIYAAIITRMLVDAVDTIIDAPITLTAWR